MRGGNRKGAGRNLKYGEPTKTVRLPAAIAEIVPAVLAANLNNDKTLCVWWLSDDESVGLDTFFESDLVAKFPEYLINLFRDRCGRNGRGRLWDAQRALLNCPEKATYCGGIVLERRHAHEIVLLPGFLQWDCQWSS